MTVWVVFFDKDVKKEFGPEAINDPLGLMAELSLATAAIALSQRCEQYHY
jgi:hypothetical protein